jgi:predicted ArsR family transcriptional regulator
MSRGNVFFKNNIYKNIYLCYFAIMKALLDENPTRRNIILLLKKSGGMSIDELSSNIDITPMGIRQHLLSLEKKGVVAYSTKKHGIGRPGFIFKLTEMAHDLFPKSYDAFALEALRNIEKNDGQEKVDRIFKWRRDRLLRDRKEALAGAEDLDDRLTGLKDILESEGYLVEVTKNNGHYSLAQFNCPIKRIADEFESACRYELELYRDLIGEKVTRTQSLSDGSLSCLYVIPSA